MVDWAFGVRCTVGFALAFAVLSGCSADDDAAPGDSAGVECEQSSCSADGTELELCEAGKKRVVRCMADEGRLCENGACVDPWAYGSPQFSTCPDEARATPESLVQKADYYDAIARRLHVHPELRWSMNVTLKAGVPEATATHADVESWGSGENDGLWSALYLASQAYRYAATRSAEALDNLRVLMEGQRTRMRVTGVPGIFTRQFIPPGVAGISCPTDDAAYTTDEEKNDNRWVQIRDDGCVWVVDRTTLAWTKSEHCGLDEFAGWCWLDNVSKDEYAGHMFGLGAVYKLVDDAAIRASAVEMLDEVGQHLLENGLQLRDWDGRITEHGRFSPLALDDFPGFNAAMAMEYVSIAAEATGRADLREFFDSCLVRREGAGECLTPIIAQPFTDFLGAAGMYIGPEGCGSNFNNISMHMLSMHHVIWFERDPDLKQMLQASFDVDVFRAPAQPRAAMHQKNAFFDFMWASQKRLGPESDGPALEAVHDGVCMLRQFPASQATPDLVLPAQYQPYCLDRFGRDAAQYPREVADRCPATFLWWGDPYSLRTCTANDRDIHQPADYLLAYWMGRYYGFIDETL